MTTSHSNLKPGLAREASMQHHPYLFKNNNNERRKKNDPHSQILTSWNISTKQFCTIIHQENKAKVVQLSNLSYTI